MNHVFARKALLSKGWANNVRITVAAGRVGSIAVDSSPEATDVIAGVVIPGLCNAHSHAFQRALAGRTEERSAAGQDNFWTWRERMYALAGQLDAASLMAVASQAYAEMLESGYTAVAEFHYLHRDPGRDERADSPDAMFMAIVKAATGSGIRLTYVPVLYERAGFDQPKPQGRQTLFALSLDEFLDHHARVSGSGSERLQIGIGAHSLRAVSNESLQELVRIANDAHIPMHLHIAEQQREVDQCLASYGRRPVRFLLENFSVRDNWCLVHATHMDVEESRALAQSAA
ncbi:MAG: amidohydrolase family protein, partial [Gammaproteobacteria bacterium]|nr:amidohydrolase family protein [Gammaproteobacteria bacterium]